MGINKKIILLLFFIRIATVSAQDIVGTWKTVDDETGKTKSIVELYKQDGAIYGKIIKLLLPEDQGKLCIKCTGSEYNKPIVGMVIAKGLTKSGDDFEGGTIFDPKKGKEYRCKMWIDHDEPNKLNVRGYIAFFFRTQKLVPSYKLICSKTLILTKYQMKK